MKLNVVKLRQQQSLHFLNSLPSKQPKSEISRQDAEAIVSRISSASCNIFKNVVILVDTKGYVALGHSKIQDCLRKRVPEFGNSYISRLLSAANLYLQLDSSQQYINKVSESTLRPLQAISIEDAKAVFDFAATTAVRRITSRDVKNAMTALNIQASVSNSKIVINLALHKAVNIQASVSSSKIVINLALHKAVVKQAQTITDAIGDSINSKEEWRHYVRLLSKQLLDNCPVDEQESMS